MHQTALHIASKNNDYLLADLLLKYKADPDAVDFGERSPLYFALCNKNHEIAKVRDFYLLKLFFIIYLLNY